MTGGQDCLIEPMTTVRLSVEHGRARAFEDVPRVSGDTDRDRLVGASVGDCDWRQRSLQVQRKVVAEPARKRDDPCRSLVAGAKPDGVRDVRGLRQTLALYGTRARSSLSGVPVPPLPDGT